MKDVSLDEIITQFDKFGQILNRQNRQFLIDYIKWKLGEISSQPSFSPSKDQENLVQICKETIDLVFTEESIEISTQFPQIKTELIKNTIDILENVWSEINLQGPFQEEESELITWKKERINHFYQNLDELFPILETYYPKSEHFNFYKKFIDNPPKNKHKQKAVKNEIINDWDLYLTQKKDALFLKQLDKARKEFLQELYAKFEEFLKLQQMLSPFTNELGRLWDLSNAQWKNVNFDILQYYAQLLEKQPELQKLAELLGRMHEAQEEFEEEMIEETIIQPKLEVEHAAKSEFVGVHESADLNHLIPSEIALLGDNLTELIFDNKFAEKKLLTYDLIGHRWGEKKISQTRMEMTPKKTKKGPIIICVDTSGSMHGTPEQVAKSLAFAILRIALRENRQCYLISFSTQIQTLELTNLRKSLMDLIKFLSFSFHGGTDPYPAFIEALRMLKSQDYARADVLMISDFIMHLDDTLHEKIESQKEKDTKFHSLVISNSGNPQVLKVFDNNWFYRLSDRNAFRETVELIQKL